MKTIALFADVGNLFYCVKKRFSDRKLDYKKYHDIVTGDNVMFSAFAYGVQVRKEAMKFITCLKHLGFNPNYITPKSYERDGKIEYKKVSRNVDIAMDVARVINKLDVVILGTSDPDILPLVKWVKEKGIACEIFACGIPKELRDNCTKWTEIEESLLEDEVTNAI